MPSVLATSLNELARKPLTSEKEKKEVYDAALRLAWSVESQQDTAQRLYHGHLPLATAQTGIDLGLFNFLAENSENAFTIEELASHTGAEASLLARLLGFYAAHGTVLQTPQGDFTASNITINLAQPGTAAGIKHYSLTMTPAYNAIPEYLRKTQYANPTDSAPFNLAYNTDMPVFEWRKHNPKNAEVGQAFMAAQRMGQRSIWEGQMPMEWFEMSEKDHQRERVMMCDVGGGLAHQCTEFRKFHPKLEGRIVTEDLPLVQNMITNREQLKDLNITLQPHNFMEEQPIKGAKVYYVRNVIHNWNDQPSKTILSQISRAMADDSVLILDEVVMPQLGVSWKQASMDLAMMTMLAAKERTRADFDKLLGSAGLRIKEVLTYDEDYGDSLIFAEILPRVDEKFASVNGEMNGYSNGVDGSVNGHFETVTNGESNGHVDAGLNEHVNGETNGHINGEINGHVNGEINGNVNDEIKGHVDGEDNGKVNGLAKDVVLDQVIGINGDENGQTNGANGIEGIIGQTEDSSSHTNGLITPFAT